MSLKINSGCWSQKVFEVFHSVNTTKPSHFICLPLVGGREILGNAKRFTAEIITLAHKVFMTAQTKVLPEQ